MDVFSLIEFRGETSELCKVAVARAGNFQIELIESKTSKSTYTDFLAEDYSGFHHMCVSTEDFEADRRQKEEDNKDNENENLAAILAISQDCAP